MEKEGYINYKDVELLSELEEKIEVLIENGTKEETEAELGKVLGTSDDGTSVKVGTEAAKLETSIGEARKLEEKTNEGDDRLVVWSGNEKEILISEAVLKAWNRKPEEVLGQEVGMEYLVTSSILPSLNGRKLSDKIRYKIVGIFMEKIKPMVYVPLGEVESMGVRNYSSLKVRTKAEAGLGVTRATIQTMGLVTRSVADTLSQIVKLFGIIRFLLGSFGAIGLVVALLGMFNTLTVSLLERTREIGVMKTLGTTNNDISRIFLAESVIMSLVGGLGGILMGKLLGELINWGLFKSVAISGQSLFVLPWWFAGFILGIALMVGMVTGWYPAKRASKISALNALRYE
jgi:hypothetical protein